MKLGRDSNRTSNCCWHWQCGTKVSTLWNTNIVMHLRNLQSSWHLSAKTTKIHAPIYFPPLPMQVLGKHTFLVFYAHSKSLGKTYKMWTAALFLNPKKNWIFNFKIEISIFSHRTQNWDSDISKLRFRYFKIEISILAQISQKLRFRDFDLKIDISSAINKIDRYQKFLRTDGYREGRLAPMVSEPASHRGCRTKELFMGSKGDGKHFVGLRFAWHGLESCCCSSVSEPASKGLAPMVSEPASHRGCQTKELFFYGFQRWREAFCRAAFCLAWARILLLFECFGTGLQGTCANGFGTSLGARVPGKRTVFYGFQRWREAFCRAAFCLAWARILLLFECFGIGLQGTCANGFGTSCLWVPKVMGSILSGCVLLGMGSNPAAVRVFRNRPPRDLHQWFGNQPRTEGARQKNCFLWVPKVTGSILSGCVLLGMGSNPAAVRVFRNRPPRDLRQWFRNQPRTEGARQKNCFLWVPKVTGSILSGCVLLGMGSNPAAVRMFRNRPPRDLRQWFRNQPRTGGARQKNCFLWVPKVTWSVFSVCVLLGMGSNPAAVRVFRNRPPKDLRFGMGSNPAAVRVFRNRPPKDLRQSDRRFPMQGHLPRWCRSDEWSGMDSKGDVKLFFGVRFAWHGLESCCCSVSEPASHRGCQTKELFFMGFKGDGKHFLGLRFTWHGLESCCCSSVSEPASKGLAPMVSEPASHRGCQTKELFFMGSKGDGKHFVGLRFAWHGLESCCCSSVSEPASKGLAPMVSEPASHRGCQTKELFFMGSKGDVKQFFGMRFAWHGLESCCCSSVSEPASKGLALWHGLGLGWFWIIPVAGNIKSTITALMSSLTFHHLPLKERGRRHGR